jgi:branched-chain amino acid transport system substrate-binding protein
MRFSDAASAINLDSAKGAVAEFRAENYEPEGYTLSSYAAVQAFAAAAKGTGGTDGAKMAEWLRANTVPTVIGDLAWDAKGDLKKVNYAWFIWHDGKYAQEPLN